MKKYIQVTAFILILFSVTTQSSTAQLSVRAEGDLMFPLAGGLLQNGYYDIPSTNGVYGSYGAGIGGTLFLDYKFSSCFLLEFSTGYWNGKKYKYDYYYNFISPKQTNIDNLELGCVSIGTLYDFCCPGQLRPFIGVGIDVAVWSRLITARVDSFYHPLMTYNYITSGKVRIGAFAESGVKYYMGNKFFVFGGLRIDVLSFMPDKKILQSVSPYYDTGNLGPLTESEMETDYKKSYTEGPLDPTKPTVEIAQPKPASRWGVTVGVGFDFGGKAGNNN